MDLQYVKIGDNEYRQDGSIVVCEEYEKSVVVDGETYYKNTYRDAIFNFGESFNSNKSNWQKYEVDMLNDFGVPTLSIWMYHGLSNSRNDKHSQNEFVNMIMTLRTQGILKSKLIKDIACGNDNFFRTIPDQIIHDLFEDRSIRFTVHGYGYNSKVWVWVKLNKFLKMDFSKINNEFMKYEIKRLNKFFPKLFPEKLLQNKLTEIEINHLMITFFNKSIHFKNYKTI